MKRECPSLFAALLVSLLVNVLLRSQDRLLAARRAFSVRWSVRRCWRALAGCLPAARGWPPTPCTSCCLARCSSHIGTGALRLWQLADRLYPGAVTLTSVCLLVVLPVVYLRRVSALSQTAYAVLCLLVLATVAMLASVFSRGCASSICKLPH